MPANGKKNSNSGSGKKAGKKKVAIKPVRVIETRPLRMAEIMRRYVTR